MIPDHSEETENNEQGLIPSGFSLWEAGPQQFLLFKSLVLSILSGLPCGPLLASLTESEDVGSSPNFAIY